MAHTVRSSKPRLLIDVDGVLGDFVGPTLDIANRLAGTSYTAEDVREWDLFNLPGLREVEDATWKVISEVGWARTQPVLPGAIAAMQAFQEIGDVRIITAPVHAPTFCYDRKMWLLENFGIKHSHVIFATEKHYVDGDMLLDDKVENVRDWLQERGRRRGGTAVLWARPYNETFDSHPRMVRTGDWSRVIEIARNLAAGD